MLFDYLGGERPIYYGRAQPGTLTSVPAWRIAKLEYDAGNNLLSMKWAEGNSVDNKVWDSRAGYTYS